MKLYIELGIDDYREYNITCKLTERIYKDGKCVEIIF